VVKRLNQLFLSFCFIATASFLFEIFQNTFIAYFIGLFALVGYAFLIINLLILVYEGMFVIVKNVKFEPPEIRLYYKQKHTNSIKIFDYIYFVMKIQLFEFFEKLYRGLVTGFVMFFAFVFINLMLGSSVVCLNFYRHEGVCFATFTDYVLIPAIASISLFMYNVVLKTRTLIREVNA
jgi:hypothetical protein